MTRTFSLERQSINSTLIKPILYHCPPFPFCAGSSLICQCIIYLSRNKVISYWDSDENIYCLIGPNAIFGREAEWVVQRMYKKLPFTFTENPRLTQLSYRWFLTHCAVSEKASAVLYSRHSQLTTAALCSDSCQSLLPTTQISPGATAFPTLVSFVINTRLSLDFCIFLCLFQTLLYHSVLKSTLFQSTDAL